MHGGGNLMKKHMVRRIKNWFSSQKLKGKVRYLFLGIIGLYITLFIFIYIFFIRKSMLDYTLESNYNTMISIGNNLNSEISTINSMSKLLTADSNINTYLLKDKPGTRYSHNAITSMYDITNTFNYVSSVYLYRLDGRYVHITNGITIVNQYILDEEEWFREIANARGGYILGVNGRGAFFRKSGKPLVSFMRIINDIETQEPIGLMVINLSDEILNDSYKDMTSNDKQFYYYDKNLKLINQIIDSKLESEIVINNKLFDQKTIGSLWNEKILSYYHIPNTPFIIAGIEKMSYMHIIPSEATWIIVLLIMLTIISLILIGLFISVYITTPIERLVQSMDIAKRGWLRRVSLKLPDDEIGHLKNSYNNMLVAINQLINELLENEKSMQKAELDVLQEQIKPHFLYNTLDTIAYLALKESSEKVYDSIETLGNFYRRFLSKGSKVIPIREEVAIVKDYLKLQKLRYDDIIQDEYDLCEDLLDVHVPKLILQPLVENSIYHGIRLKGEKGLIKITVCQIDDFIHIVVYDSGVGMNKEQLKQIMQDNNKSFGFKGTIERIRYYYGKEDVFEIKSEEGLYTQIDLKIPL